MLSAVKENCSLSLGDSPLHPDVKFAQGDISDVMQIPEYKDCGSQDIIVHRADHLPVSLYFY